MTESGVGSLPSFDLRCGCAGLADASIELDLVESDFVLGYGMEPLDEVEGRRGEFTLGLIS